MVWETAVGADNRGLRWVGYTDNYIRVQAHGATDLFNRITPVLLTESYVDRMSGTIKKAAV